MTDVAIMIVGFVIALLGTFVPRYLILEDAPCKRNTGAIALIECYPVTSLGFLMVVVGLILFAI